MRLVDADALKEAMREKFKTVPERCEINEVINAAPTVNAIPVEWLEAHKTENYEDWGNEPITVDLALKMWQKEQEAR